MITVLRTERLGGALREILQSKYLVPILFVFAFFCWFFKLTLLVVFVFCLFFSLILFFCRDVKNIYIYPTDQYPYAVSHDAGLFLNQPTKVMLGSAGLAHKLGMSVLYLRMRQLERGRYEMTFVPICQDASALSPEDIMRKYLDLLEADIRETPYNWLWSHKRWKR